MNLWPFKVQCGDDLVEVARAGVLDEFADELAGDGEQVLHARALGGGGVGAGAGGLERRAPLLH